MLNKAGPLGKVVKDAKQMVQTTKESDEIQQAPNQQYTTTARPQQKPVTVPVIPVISVQQPPSATQFNLNVYTNDPEPSIGLGYSWPSRRRTPSPENRTEAAVNSLHWTILRQQQEDQRRRRQKELYENRAPRYGTIRHWVNSPDGPLKDPVHHQSVQQLDNVLSFSKAHAHVPTRNRYLDNVIAVFAGIKACPTEQDSRNFIHNLKKELEIMLENSDIPDMYKEKFHRALNTADYKDNVRIMTVVLGAIIFAATAPVCFTLAAQGAVAKCAATSMFCALMTAGPYLLAETFFPSKRYFPTTSGPICEPQAFRSWISELNNVVEATQAYLSRPSIF